MRSGPRPSYSPAAVCLQISGRRLRHRNRERGQGGKRDQEEVYTPVRTKFLGFLNAFVPGCVLLFCGCHRRSLPFAGGFPHIGYCSPDSQQQDNHANQRSDCEYRQPYSDEHIKRVHCLTLRNQASVSTPPLAISGHCLARVIFCPSFFTPRQIEPEERS